MGKQPRAEGTAATKPRQLPDFTRLPARVPPDELTTTQDVDPAPDPYGGRDTETEFMLRHIGGI
jgi:hypothetical protein